MTNYTDINRAVELTIQCKSVDYDWKVMGDQRWHAVLWCNAIGDYVTGFGKDAWTAVQKAHELKAAEEKRVGYETL